MLLRTLKGFFLIVFVLSIIFLVGQLDKGVETHEPDRLYVYPKFGGDIHEIVDRVPGAKLISEYNDLVEVPARKLKPYEETFLADPMVLGIKYVAVKPEFTFRKYWAEVRNAFDRYLSGDLGGVSYDKPDPYEEQQIYPVDKHLGEMVKRSLSYLIPAVLTGVLVGYLLALFAVWKPKWGRVFDGFHTVLLGLPDFFIVVVLQLLAIQVSKAAGHNVILIMQFGDSTPFLIPFLAISLLPAALIYGTLRIAVEREWEEGYVKTAYAKGLSRTFVILRHLLRNTREDLLAILPRVVTAGITSLVVAEIMAGIFGLGGYALNPKMTLVTSLPTTCAILAVIGLAAHFLLAALRRLFVVTTKEVV
ncbi:MAG TPA: ABC transporter permease subunit [Bacilli bacterium]|nr:ABC transporter permease subunit [Bacilli bacterium]